MLEVITSKSEIRKVQTRLEVELNKNVEQHGAMMIGYQGGNEKLKISWNGDLGIWWTFYSLENRFWNTFGTEEPEWESNNSHSITCGINPPFEGINRRMAGVFAKDSLERYYVLHRGNIGGGRKGIGKSSFNQEFRGKRVDVQDGDDINKLALVAFLDSPRFPQQLANFVHEVDRIKIIAIEGKEVAPILDNDFSSEFSGTRSYRVESNDIEANCDHGLVVNALADQLQEKGMKVGNTKNIDLYVVDTRNDVKITFEIKTSVMTSHYYQSIGQLLFHSAKLKKKPRLVAVFPNDISGKTIQVFDEIGIQCLTYKWKENEPVFSKLERFTL